MVLIAYRRNVGSMLCLDMLFRENRDQEELENGTLGFERGREIER